MASVLSNLKPTLLWKHFDEIRAIPHCSKSETPLAEYVLGIAKKKGLEAERDDAGNVVIRKIASPGHEKAKTVILQGHLDMVCEKNSDLVHDFSKDPIHVQIAGEWVTAKGTTLGADNGIGIAAALALLEDDSIVHGPIECLFTIDEETGLTGATMLKPDLLKGKTLMNLDSEEEGCFFIGCAGGADSEISLPIQRKDIPKGTLLKVTLSGLRGGHSGIDINTGRGNAIQLLARIFFGLDVPFDLIDIEGGNKHNAIPREVFSRLISPDKEVGRLKKALHHRFDEIGFEYKAVEKEMKLTVEPDQTEMVQPLDDASKGKLINLLFALPHGAMAMSQEIPGLVETSNNLAIIRCREDLIYIHTSSRSSILTALEAVRAKIESITSLTGAQIHHLEGYPAWTPNLDSPLLAAMKKTYKKLTGKEPEIKAIHAGLECGIIGKKLPGMDMISFGPELKYPHSPDERVHIGSVEQFWNLLTAALRDLA